MFKKLQQFIEELIAEFKRVHYPDREATLKSTTVVLILSLVIAVFLGIADLGLSNLMQQIIAS